MSKYITLESLEENLEFFNKMYDFVRIVDPLEKRVLECKGNKTDLTEEVCYSYWKSGKICDNCISTRAFLDNKTFIKLEQSPDAIMLVTAMPIDNTEKPVVLELLKDATDSMFLGSGDYNEGHMMFNVVSKINDIITKDSLTNLFNRRFIDERLPIDIIKATVEKTPLSLIFMDLDNLKEINDTYGHYFGDLAIKELGQVLVNSVRNHEDWVARYGGDEFIICLNNTNYEDAYTIGCRIVKKIADTNIETEKGIINLTASIGIHTMEDTNLSAQELIKHADQNMYLAKQKGKNCAF